MAMILNPGVRLGKGYDRFPSGISARVSTVRNQRADRVVLTDEAVSVRRQSVKDVMLYWALVFLIVAIIAAIFGFGGVAATAASIAKILFFIFLVIFLITLAMGMVHRRRPPPI